VVPLACDWHVCPDAQSPWDHTALWLRKDADGLDRARLGDLDPAFLRSPQARSRVADAHALYLHTRALTDATAVWEQAHRMGLPGARILLFRPRPTESAGPTEQPPAPCPRGPPVLPSTSPAIHT
jgi:hypothetical protein